VETVEAFATAHSLIEKGRTSGITSGIDGIDGLLGSIERGTSYLFHGDESIMGHLVHRLLINEALSELSTASDFHIIYINNTDYYSYRTLLDVNLLGVLCKRAGVDPYSVFNGITMFAAYSPGRQLEVAAQASRMARSYGDTSLIIFHNPACFMDSERTKDTGFKSLSQSFVELWQASIEAGSTLLTTSPSYAGEAGSVPEAVGSRYLRHLSAVVAHFEKIKGLHADTKVTLVKHPSRRTPVSVLVDLHSEKVNQGLGRVTPPFHMLYDQMMEDLRQRYQATLVDPDRRKAFDSLLDEAWFPEQAAMNNSFLPSVIDQLNLTANVDNRRLISTLLDRISALEEEVTALRQRLGEG
jgi:hypothetical protein